MLILINFKNFDNDTTQNNQNFLKLQGDKIKNIQS